MDESTAVAVEADAGWATGPLLGFDTETTGLDVASDRVVTAALVLRVPGVRTEVRTWLLDPGVEIPPEATAIHGITTAHARERGHPPAEALDEIASVLTYHVRRGVPVVAYNAAFDLSLLDAELARHGLPTVPDRLGRPVGPVLDPLVIDRWQDADREGKRRLGDLCALYGVVGDGDLHSADVDALATLDVLAALLTRYPHLRATALEALHVAQAGVHRDWAASVDASPAWPCEPPSGAVPA
ncbi:exonuclease domain-containing protein [Isoptericola variabilis]|uniref:Exonuclease RNase T and DNA polymerase III n=1 Tax=Isoptericola variabilis (strain 225) TaxID=743718 RepID=F6FWT5_ISOV2|nr:exonuclease domain-containing protein [Isoptericola variabilis]AEG43507.1 Exonuclease RNase T and DNA polymerase III [Isoptericola variabilis 225]TWH32127.1 DNA polymerase-3 subunit epsilon [Isoptericola variabilis J7]